MAAATAEAKGSEAKTEAPAEGEAKAPAPASGGGIKAFLPLIIAIVAMPALAFVMTNYVLLPKIKSALGKAAPAAAEAPAESAGKETAKEGVKPGAPKFTVPLTKVLVNVAGTMGTRYLMTSFTLVGKNADFKAKIDDNKDQLLDLAQSTLRSKTIADLEKPGSQNVIRNELMTVFNNALGGPVVQEIYITEMAIQ